MLLAAVGYGSIVTLYLRKRARGDPVLGDENGDREQAKTQNLKITRANGTYAHLDDYLGVGQRRHDGGVARNAR